jgi:ribonuclease P protein component
MVDSPESVSGDSATNPSPRQTLGKAQRLTRSAQIREGYAQGEKSVGRYLVLWVRRSSDASCRLGVVASKKGAGNAVNRARAKRRLRSVFRLNRASLISDVDVVIVARHALLKAGFDDLQNDFLTTSKKAGILSE